MMTTTLLVAAVQSSTLLPITTVDDGFALAMAPLIGFAFGWFLERGGLGSARKLAGQFYLTDFTVFQVMFSAIVTTLLGTFWLARIGLLDLSALYVPETYLLPQTLGGAIFGVGFLVSGLCPGTSCVAGASGRIDGLATVGGMLGGVLLFNLMYGQVESLYAATPRGNLLLTDVSGLSYGALVALIVGVALAAFRVLPRLVRTTGAAETATLREPPTLTVNQAVEL